MKKIISSIIASALISGAVSAAAEDAISIVLNGNTINFDVQPQIINERTMVPLRAIFEALGASVDWNDDTKTVTSTKDNTTVRLTINNPYMTVNESTIELDSPACIVNERTLVPVRAVSEAFGIAVDWDNDTKTVIMSSAVTSYIDLTENVKQINSFINEGLYLEAIHECETAKTYNISDYDKNLLDDLKNTAQWKYNEYIARTKEKEKFLSKAAAIEEYTDNYLRTAYYQLQMNKEASIVYYKWDTLLNEVYQYLKTILSSDEFEKLTADELNWVQTKENAMSEASAMWEGGTGEPFARYTTGIIHTSERCYYLISMIN